MTIQTILDQDNASNPDYELDKRQYLQYKLEERPDIINSIYTRITAQGG